MAPGTPHGFTQEQFVDLQAMPNATYDRMKRSDTVRFLVVDHETQENTRAVLLQRDSIGLHDFEALAMEMAASEPDTDFEAAFGLCQVVDAGRSQAWRLLMVSPDSQVRMKGHRFPRSVISYAVRCTLYAVWAYHRFALSLRDVEDLLAERGYRLL